jgi:rSAM/selenodomain-associated transferase 2
MDRRLAVIIPVLNEAAALPALLDDLAAQRGLKLSCIVADGGSDDASRQLAATRGARLVRAPRGRGSQMNHGADAARADWLLFLHADSRLEHSGQLAEALAAVQQAARSDLAVAGHWPLRFRRSQPGGEFFFRYLEGKTASQRRYSIHGDQGLLIHRDYFQALGGFDTRLPIFEDDRLADDIFATGRWLLLPGRLSTSARRFESEGPAARYALMALMVAAEAGGLDAYLREVPGLYREQAQTRRLRLRPFLEALRDRLEALPPAQQRVFWERLGRLLCDNAWQLAYGLDQLRGAGLDGPLLRAHDRLLAPRLAQPWAGRLAAGLVQGLLSRLPRPPPAGGGGTAGGARLA